MRSGLPGGRDVESVSPAISVCDVCMYIKLSPVLIKSIEETLAINVKPSKVRLKTIGTDVPYTWQIDDPSMEPLFEKHLSKHSVGAYMRLYREVGRSFRAVPLDDNGQVLETYPQEEYIG